MLILIAALSFTACTQNEPEEAAASRSEYTQTRIDFPERVYWAEILGKASNGKFWMTGFKESADPDNLEITCSLWELNDDNSWTELVNIRELLGLKEEDFLATSVITESNEVLCCVASVEGTSYTGMRLYLINPELESHHEVNIDTSGLADDYIQRVLPGSIQGLYALPDDQILIQASVNSFLVLDLTNETINVIPSGEDKTWSIFRDVVKVGDTVYVLYENRADGRFTELTTKLCTLDISTGIFTDVDDEELTCLLNEYGVKEPQRIIPTIDVVFDSAEKITMCLRGGIIEYGNNEARVIADAEDTIMSDKAMDIRGMFSVNEDDFILFGNEVDQLDSMALYKYEKTAA